MGSTDRNSGAQRPGAPGTHASNSVIDAGEGAKSGQTGGGVDGQGGLGGLDTVTDRDRRTTEETDE